MMATAIRGTSLEVKEEDLDPGATVGLRFGFFIRPQYTATPNTIPIASSQTVVRRSRPPRRSRKGGKNMPKYVIERDRLEPQSSIDRQDLTGDELRRSRKEQNGLCNLFPPAVAVHGRLPGHAAHERSGRLIA